MRHSLIVVLVLLMTASSAMAQHVEQGDKEIQVNAFFFAVSGVSMLNLSGIYGYYKTAKLELGGGPSISYMSYGSESNTTIGLTFFGRYNLTARDQIVPYISAQFYQYDIAPEDPLGFADYAFVQCGGGFKYFINEYIAYDVSGNLGFSLGGGEVSFIAVGGLSAFF
ncbi:MAG: hypothetical protein KOO63_11045 [Bacteroidales bacterium]|nr:hypothetical protein [Candidatus Latescibacterota bacterium]